jgi:hypothetical protein
MQVVRAVCTHLANEVGQALGDEADLGARGSGHGLVEARHTDDQVLGVELKAALGTIHSDANDVVLHGQACRENPVCMSGRVYHTLESNA